MKSGLTIVEMAQQIERQSKLKQDYLLDTRRLQVEPFGSQLYLHTFDDHDLKQGGYGIREIARTQKVPMRRIKELLAEVHDVLLDICYG